MRRQIPGFILNSRMPKAALMAVSGPCGKSLVPMASAKAVHRDPICRFGTEVLRSALFLRPPVLHREGAVEAQLVSSGFWLRTGTAQPRSSG